MSYSATNYGSQPLPRGKGTKWLVGVHHKPSGTVRLVEAQHLYHMAPRVKQPRLPLDPPGSREQISNLQAKRNLVNEMGSAKAQKKQMAEMAKQISPDAVFNSANLSADLASLAQVEAPKPKTPQELRPPISIRAYIEARPGGDAVLRRGVPGCGGAAGLGSSESEPA